MVSNLSPQIVGQVSDAAQQEPDISVVVPTYCEAENIPILVQRMGAVAEAQGIALELILVDDNSPDGTPEVVAALHKPWVRLIVRTKERGLATAVIRGLEAARADLIISMDADLSHPPEALPAMLAELRNPEVDFVIGSRYAPGGSTDDDWGVFRLLNSKAATLLARPFTSAHDPMAGFFGIRRQTIQLAPHLNPVGYKIALELIVKCGCRRVAEVPIHFSKREKGHSKLNFNEQLNYLRHVKRLADFKYGMLSHVAQFALVGGLGTAVNLSVLTLLILLGVLPAIAVAAAIFTAMACSFFVNLLLAIAYTNTIGIIWQFLRFTAICSPGMIVNFVVSMLLIHSSTLMEHWPQFAALGGIAMGMGPNFLGRRAEVFKANQSDAQPRDYS